ncbi:unnamed protein product [Ectocarpus sp. 6 AP-2014]
MMMSMASASTAAPWGSGGGGFNAASGLFRPAATGQNPNLPAGGVATSGLPHDQATGGKKSTTAVPAPSPAPQVAAGSGGGGGGAEWMPPAEQVPEYDALFRSASAGCAVPGTVSGRIAVQFFSRSGLSKDVLKTIWSLCDPSLTGSIRRPGFFAAMRLIALAQQGSLPSQGMAPFPSISALEATRHARLPPPRMGGFPSGVGVGADVGGGGSDKMPPASSAAAPAVLSPFAVAATASPPSVFSNTFQAPPPTAVGPGSEVSMGNNNNAVWGTAGDEPKTESAQQRSLPSHEAVASAPTTPDGEDDDFGEFAGCQEEPQQQPTPPPTDQSQDDDFGEFSGAPGGDAPATAVASPASLAAERGASPVATNAPRTAEPSASGAAAAGGDAWMMGGGGGGSVGSTVDSGKGAGGEAGGGNLDDLIKTNVQEASAGPLHLSDMTPTPPLAEKAHNPVMVDRASSSRTKLSVFDEMADLDLAVGQEDWNDFADETTAPPRSPTPSPPPSPPPPPPTTAEEAVKAADVDEPAIDDAISDSNADIRGEPRPLDQDPEVGSGAGGSSSPAAMVEDEQQQQQQQQQAWPGLEQQGMPPVSLEGSVAASAHASIADGAAPAAAAAAEGAQAQDDEWGNFEDATAGGEGTTGQQDLPGPEGEVTAVREDTMANDALDDDNDALDDDDEEEWGTFADAPEAAAGEEAGLAIGDASSTGGSPEAPPEEAVDPFADIAPATPPPPPLRPPTVGATAEEEEAGRLGSEEGGGSGPSPSGAAATTTVTAPGLPLSLRGLRDALAKRGRLEEAVEVQRRMELPSTPPPRAIDVPYSPEDVTADDDANADADGGGGEAEDADLERWRAAAAEDLRPFPTVEELAATMSAADAARGEKFRERLVCGRPPVEEEALAGGGGAAVLGVAVRRQRSARRAVCLLSMLDAAGTAGDGAADKDLEDGRDGGLTSGGGGEKEDEDKLELDLGLDTRRARSPPSLADWAAMMSYVTSMAARGIEALAGGGAGSRSGSNRAAATPASPTRPSSPFSRPTTEREGADCRAEIDSAGVPPDADALASNGGVVRREVARSQEFESFCRGLREAVKVCRMLQASAEDGCCLQGVDGFAAMERAWAELRRSAREAAAAAAGDDGGGDLPSVFGVEDGEEGVCMGKQAQGVGGSPGAASGLVGGKDERTAVGGGVAPAGSSSVAAIREACVETPPPAEDSALCGVSLQPLAVFSGGAGGGGGGGGSGVEPPGVVEYCGVRYLACAINLWVNVLDKPPPGPSPDKKRET